ncbi:hypothetical protein AAY473_027387, partial [Plecturocebus cupreus]
MPCHSSSFLNQDFTTVKNTAFVQMPVAYTCNQAKKKKDSILLREYLENQCVEQLSSLECEASPFEQCEYRGVQCYGEPKEKVVCPHGDRKDGIYLDLHDREEGTQ